jgi:hypothetical protein
MYQIDRWTKQQRQGGKGYTPPGAKRDAYINSLKPQPVKAPLPAPATEPARIFLNGGLVDTPPGFIQPRLTVPGGWYDLNPTTYYTSINTGGTAAGSYRIGSTLTGNTVTGGNIGYTGWTNAYGGPLISFGGDGRFASAETPQQQTRRRYQQQLVMPDPQDQHGHRARALKPAADFSRATVPEIVALDLLKQQLSSEAWRRYLNYGFIVVRGASGLEYQIIRGEHHVKVFARGRRIAELCLYVQGVPPTDEVITKKILVECDELGVWGRANIRNHPTWPSQYQPRLDELRQIAAVA